MTPQRSPAPPPLVVPLTAIGATDIQHVGGKAAGLGELLGCSLPVPDGFCVTTAAFDAFLEVRPEALAVRVEIGTVGAEDIDAIRAASQRMTGLLQHHPLPAPVRAAVAQGLEALGAANTFAVRSSATLEDLPDASFAGQHDSYLAVRGIDQLLDRLRDCWLSLFTDRAIAYRRRNRLAEAAASMAVVVQVMAAADVAGVLFTADPVSGSRDTMVIDASYGLGESVVAGTVTPDSYRVRRDTGEVIDVAVGDKASAIQPLASGGTASVAVADADRRTRVLGDEQIRALRELGLAVEACSGAHRDIEWCLAEGKLWLLQARPITSLFPAPQPQRNDGVLRVYMCMGHQQANPAAWSPFTCSVLATFLPGPRVAGTARSVIAAEAGHRVYIDLTAALLRPPLRSVLQRNLAQMSPAIGRGLEAVASRPDFLAGRSKTRLAIGSQLPRLARAALRVAGRLVLLPPARVRADWARFIEAQEAWFDGALRSAGTVAAQLRLLPNMLQVIVGRIMFGMAMPVLVPGMMCLRILERWLGPRVGATTIAALTRGLRGNIVTAMDHELGDIADLVRGLPAVRQALLTEPAEQAAALARTAVGGDRFSAAWDQFLQRYGHRGPGEIDIARSRWRDDPTPLVRAVVGMLGGDAAGAHRRRHEQARADSERAADDILATAGSGLWGGPKRALARALIRRVRCYLAMREHHKFTMILLWGKVRALVQQAAATAVSNRWLEDAEGIWMLTLDELIELLDPATPGASSAAGATDGTTGDQEQRWAAARVSIARRAAAHQRYQQLTPPAVLLSNGEVPVPRRSGEALPAGVLEGVAVSAGVAEGVARVLRDPAEETLAAGEILVAPFTDAAWTTLFVHAAGLVLEAGGAMSHGSVIAREYGIPAVVGVSGATARITSGQRVRVDGGSGLVTILDASSATADAAAATTTASSSC